MIRIYYFLRKIIKIPLFANKGGKVKVNVFDVVCYVLGKLKSVTAMKLQKLVYYCQAWSLVWDGKPLFNEKIETWASGPVVKDLYIWHRGRYEISNCSKGDMNKLEAYQRETIDSVISYYGDKSPQWLSDLTHMEDPWKLARSGLKDGERGNTEISLATMEEYYSSIMEPSNIL